jgi:type II secretory pathway pseudopilin PulG
VHGAWCVVRGTTHYASRTTHRGEQGFTLAALIVILTIMMIFVAYTVPRMWSTVMQREREQETIFAMRQYARAIYDFQDKHKALPTSMDQLTKARQPRFLRGGPKSEIADPLTGEVDWMLIPATALNQGPQLRNGPAGPAGPGGGSGGTTTNPTTGSQGQQPATTIPAFPMKDWAGGPFIGVRPNKTGKSMLTVNGADQYDQWNFTYQDIKAEIDARRAAVALVTP